MNKDVQIFQNVHCYEENGVAYLRLEDVARGLGFTQEKNGVEYVKWERVNSYLESFGFSPQVGKDNFIPENIFYRLCMKAKNETAEAFQTLVCDEVLPSIRKTGSYSVSVPSYQIEDPIARATKWIEEEKERQALAAENKKLLPKAEYFDDLVDANICVNFRETAKEIHAKPKEFTEWLIQQGYIFRGQDGTLVPYAEYGDLFHVKEYIAKNGHAGLQTRITPKGRETFRLLYPSTLKHYELC